MANPHLSSSSPSPSSSSALDPDPIARIKSAAQHLHDQAARHHPGLCDPEHPTAFPESDPAYRWQRQHDLAVYHGGAICVGMGGDAFNVDPDEDGFDPDSVSFQGYSGDPERGGYMGWLAMFREWTKQDREELKSSDYGDPENQAYPIEDQADVEAAAHLIGQAEDSETTKKRIIAICKRKKLTIPEAWKSDAQMSGRNAPDDSAHPFDITSPSTWAAFDSELNNRIEDGERVKYLGAKLFKVGDYPDKAFALTRDEARSTVSQFTTPVPLELEHINSSGVRTFLDDEYGQLESVRLSDDGDWIVGDVQIDSWVDRKWDKFLAKSGEKHKQVSCVLDRANKAINKLGLVIKGRVDGAALTAAFSVDARDDDSRIDDLFAGFAKDRTVGGQMVLQSIHDRAAEAGAVCSDDPKFAAVLFHSSPELASIQAAHDAACGGGATCKLYDKSQPDKRYMMFAELATFTERKKHKHTEETHQIIHDVIANGYPMCCSGGPMAPPGPPANVGGGSGTGNAGAASSSVAGGSPASMSDDSVADDPAAFADVPEQLKALRTIHNLSVSHGASCPGDKSKKPSAKPDGKSAAMSSKPSSETHTMSREALTKAVGALPEKAADITEDQVKAVVAAFTATLPDDLKAKVATFAAEAPDPYAAFADHPKFAEFKAELERTREADRKRIEELEAKDRKAIDVAMFSDANAKAEAWCGSRNLAGDHVKNLTNLLHAATKQDKLGGDHAPKVAFSANGQTKDDGSLSIALENFLANLPAITPAIPLDPEGNPRDASLKVIFNDHVKTLTPAEREAQRLADLEQTPLGQLAAQRLKMQKGA